MPAQTDWHKPGIFIVRAPTGDLLPDTLATTAYASRAEFLRSYPAPWRSACSANYVLLELAPVAQMEGVGAGR